MQQRKGRKFSAYIIIFALIVLGTSTCLTPEDDTEFDPEPVAPSIEETETTTEPDPEPTEEPDETRDPKPSDEQEPEPEPTEEPDETREPAPPDEQEPEPSPDPEPEPSTEQDKVNEHIAEKADLIQVNMEPDKKVGSPLTITGKARGVWYFEGDFVVYVYDENGEPLGRAPAMALDNWMTEDFVEFKVTVEFDNPETSTGYVVFKKDNPKGDPEFDDELIIPVRFSDK